MKLRVVTTGVLPVTYKLQKERKKQKLTQVGLGESAGVCATTVSRAENGKNVNFTSAILILARLGVIPYGTHSLEKLECLAEEYLRATDKGRHAKGWVNYTGRASQAKAA